MADPTEYDAPLPAAHHFRGAPGCRLRRESVTESPNCWCPRDAPIPPVVTPP